MARFHGRAGSLMVDLSGGGGLPSPVANISKWTVDRQTDKVEVTSLGDINKTYVSGLPDAKGTFTGFLDDTANQLYGAASDGVPRAFYLYARVPGTLPGVYWYGMAIWDMSASGGVSEAAGVSGTWTASGPVYKVPA